MNNFNITTSGSNLDLCKSAEHMKPYPSIVSKLVFLSFLTLAISASAQWSNIGSNPQQYFRQISFPSANIGYAILDDSGTAVTTFHKTTNAGNAWQQITLPSVFSTADVISMHFPSDDVGYIAFRAFVPGLIAFVYKTTNGGNDWKDVTPFDMNLGNGYMGIQFLNNDTGFAFSGNVLYKTTNGGTNWNDMVFESMGGPIEFDFNQNQHGMMGAWDGSFGYRGFIYTTEDEGATWDTLDLPVLQSAIREVQLTEDNVAYGLTSKSFADGPTLYRSDNGGASWDSLSLSFLSDSLDTASDILFTDGATGYISTYQGYIYITLDSGNTWQIDHIEPNPLNFMAASNVSVYSGGPLHTLLKKTFSTSVNEISTEANFRVFPNPANDVVQLDFPSRITGQLYLLDSKGAYVHQENLNDVQRTMLDLSSLQTSGIYLIKVQTDAGVMVQRLVVE